MNLHIFYKSGFVKPFVEFINNNFDEDHKFIVIGKTDLDIHNVVSINSNTKSLMFLAKEMNKAKKIYIHGLFMTILILFFQPWLLKRCRWIVWGSDLYRYNKRNDSPKFYIYELMRKFVIKNFDEIITVTKGDYDLARKWYNVKGKYKKGVYINPVKIEYLKPLTTNEITNIQIGNSADPSNNHIEVLESLSKFKDENIKIYVPLSYGNMEYAKTVKDFGEKLFGDKFVAMLDFMKPEEYSNFLSSIDVAIFANRRQQGLGNIYALLYVGTKIFIRNDVSTWNFIHDELEINISNYLELDKLTFNEFKEFSSSEDNRNKIMKVFDEEEIKKIWTRIFE